MKSVYEELKAWAEAHLKNSKYWPLATNNLFFDNSVRHPGAIVGLAEGDSWFDYEFISRFVHFDGADLIGHLSRGGEFNILRLSFAGDTLRDMAGEPQMTNLREVMRLMTMLDDWIGRERFRPKFVLLSGGGNDMSGNHGVRLDKFLDAGGLDEHKVFHAIDVEYRRQFDRLISNVRDVDETVPIFLHGYAYPVPDGRGVRSPNMPIEFDFEGPWLKPAFDRHGISFETGCEIMVRLIDRFNAMLAKLAAEYAEHDGRVHHIDLRGSFPNPLTWVMSATGSTICTRLPKVSASWPKCSGIRSGRGLARIEPAVHPGLSGNGGSIR